MDLYGSILRFKMWILGHRESIIVGIVESIFGPLGVDFWPLNNDRGIELGTLEVVIRSQGIEFRPMGFESKFFNHNVNFLGLCYPISDS